MPRVHCRLCCLGGVAALEWESDLSDSSNKDWLELILLSPPALELTFSIFMDFLWPSGRSKPQDWAGTRANGVTTKSRSSLSMCTLERHYHRV
jgi:hypothetical protein